MRVAFLNIEKILGSAARTRRLARSWPSGGAALIVLCLLVYIPGLWTIPPVDRDESRFAQASRQMLESGTLEGWVVPRVQDRPRLNKPPLIYWLQAGSAFVLGDAPGEWAWLDGGSENIWVYRVPSVLSAMFAVLMTWRIGLRMFDPRAAWLGAALLGVCPMVVWDAHQARADQLLLAMTTATMGCLWLVWKGSRERPFTQRHGGTEKTEPSPSVPPCLREKSVFPSAIRFWVFLALGIMTKGPITPMIAALAIVSLCLISRDWSLVRRLRPLIGIVIVAAIVGPWVAMVGNEIGWSKYLSIVYDETIGRSAGAKEGHWGPPGYHIVLLGVLFWPGSLLTAAAIGRAWRRGMRRNITTESTERHGDGDSVKTSPRRRLVPSWLRGLKTARPGRDAELFCLAWMLPAWIVFELIGTKLPHYTMPLYPAVAMMSARLVMVHAGCIARLRLTPAGRSRVIHFLESHHAPCPSCKYDLHRLTDNRCPECGDRLELVENLPNFAPGQAIRTLGRDRSQRWGNTLWLGIGVAIFLVVPAVLVCDSSEIKVAANIFPIGNWTLQPTMLLAAILAGVLMIAALESARRSLRAALALRATVLAAGVTIVFSLAVLGVMLPRFGVIWVTRDIMRHVRVMDPAGLRTVADTSYQEDSLVFQTRGRLVRISNMDSVIDLLKHDNTAILITDFITYKSALDNIETYDRDSPAIDRPARTKQSASGYNYSRGKRVHLDIIDLESH